MSKSTAAKQCDIFTRALKTSMATGKAIPPSPPSDLEANANMANIAEVLSELKSLRADIRTKLDNIDTRLTGMANSMAVLECSVSEVKRDVTSNATHIKEADRRIHDAKNLLEKKRNGT